MFEEAARLGYAFCLATGNKWSTGPLLTRFKMLRPLDARLGFGLPRRREPGPAAELRADLERRGAALAAGQSRGPLFGGPARRQAAILVADRPARAWAPSSTRAPGPRRPRRPRPGAGAAAASGWGWTRGIDWKGSAFLPIPMRLRPSPLNLVYKDLTGGGFLPDPDRIVFRGLDFDAF